MFDSIVGVVGVVVMILTLWASLVMIRLMKEGRDKNKLGH
jgi:hypothetical protein